MSLYIGSAVAAYVLYQVNDYLDWKRTANNYGYKAAQKTREIQYGNELVIQLQIIVMCLVPWVNLIIIGMVLRDMYENYLSMWVEKQKIRCRFYIKRFLNKGK